MNLKNENENEHFAIPNESKIVYEMNNVFKDMIIHHQTLLR